MNDEDDASYMLGYKILTKDADGGWRDDWSDYVFRDLSEAITEKEEAEGQGHIACIVSLVQLED